MDPAGELVCCVLAIVPYSAGSVLNLVTATVIFLFVTSFILSPRCVTFGVTALKEIFQGGQGDQKKTKWPFRFEQQLMATGLPVMVLAIQPVPNGILRWFIIMFRCACLGK